MYDQQMDGQDEWSRRIYNNRDLTERKKEKKRRQDNRNSKTPESSGREASENQEEEEFILRLNPRISLYPFSTHLTIPLPYDPVRLLKKPSLRPNS